MKPISKARRRLLVRLESILGNECYNASTQNYGPGGVREVDGRGFRYPLTLRAGNELVKVRQNSIPDSATDEMLCSGFYAFGANQLDVMSALDKVLQYLEAEHDLVIDAQSLVTREQSNPPPGI